MVQHVTYVHVLTAAEQMRLNLLAGVAATSTSALELPEKLFPDSFAGKTANAVGEERADTNVDTNAHANRSHNARPSLPSRQHLVLRLPRHILHVVARVPDELRRVSPLLVRLTLRARSTAVVLVVRVGTSPVVFGALTRLSTLRRRRTSSVAARTAAFTAQAQSILLCAGVGANLGAITAADSRFRRPATNCY
jgi:hypothetical protein